MRKQMALSGAQLHRIAELCIEERARWDNRADRDPQNYRAMAMRHDEIGAILVDVNTMLARGEYK